MTVFFTASLAGWGATITSVKDGDWSDASTWDNGIPGPSDNVIITYDVTIDNAERANCYDLTIKPGVYLYVKTGLLVGNNFKMEFDGDTDSYFEMEDGAYVVVAGNVELSNKVNLHLASYFIVKGNITGATSGQTELSIEDGSHIYFLKDVDKQLKLTSECGGNYDETNNYNSSKCDYGALEDYVEDFDSFPEEVKKALKCSSLTFHTNSISIAP